MARKKTEPAPPVDPVTIDPVNDAPPADEPEMQLTVLENTSVFRWNFEEIKARLLSGIEKYTGLTVTDENLPDMEKTAREIASLRTKVNRFRIDTKKQLTATADKFDAEVKELATIIDQAEAPLKEQLQKHEDERVKAKETELLQFAWKTCVAIGIRDEHYQTYQVPSKLTQRGTSDKQAKQEVASAMEVLYQTQLTQDALLAEQARLKEESEKQRQTRRDLLEILCKSRSQGAGLQTPVTVEDIERQYPLLDSIDTPDLPGVVDREIERRAKIEQAAQRTVDQTDNDQQAAALGLPKIMVPPPMPASPVMGTPPVTTQGPPPTAPIKLWDVTLKFRCTTAQAGQLKPMFAAQGLTYEVVTQTEVSQP